MFKEIRKPEQLPIFPDFEGNGEKREAEDEERVDKKIVPVEDMEPESEQMQPPDVDSWSFDVPEGGAEQYGSAKESVVLYQKEKGWLVVDSKGKESDISWAGVKLLLAKNYDFLLRTDEKFQKLVQYFDGKQKS